MQSQALTSASPSASTSTSQHFSPAVNGARAGPSFGTTDRSSSPSIASPVVGGGPKSAGAHYVQTARSEAGAPTDPFAFHSVTICESLWKVGWQSGAYSDIELHVRSRSYKLHRLILSRSPYLAHLMEINPLYHPVWVPMEDESLTDEAVAIVLGHLYAAYPYGMVNTQNARDVLTTATLFGLPDVSSYVYDICKSSINAESITSWVEWCESQNQRLGAGAGQFGYPNGGGFTMNDGIENLEGGWAMGGTNEVTSKLRMDIYNYLIHSLVPELASVAPSPQNYTPTTNPHFLRIFSTLPFDLFKSCIEEKALPLGSDQERFAFAKKAIAARKKRAGPPATGQEVAVENVVLQFTGGSGSNVHVTRKAKAGARPLWKVVKD